MSTAVKLNDEQMRRFVCDGFLVLGSIEDKMFHQVVVDKLQYLNAHEPDIRNNVLPRISELQRVLDAPQIRGAIESILGPDFMLHPHRLSTPGEPLPPERRQLKLSDDVNGPPVGEGSKGFTVWHKDKLGRTRYHTPRFLYLFYFPQNTPIKRGPTRVIPGSQYYDHLTKEDYPFAYVPDQLTAGSCILTSIDIDHAGMTNVTDQTRNMIKFNFIRTQNPSGPSWDGGQTDWRNPEKYSGRYKHEEAWSYIWDWLRGHREQKSPPIENIQKLISGLNSTNQAKRLHCIYALGSMGDKAVEPLIASLEKFGGHDLMDPINFSKNAEGGFDPVGDIFERRWAIGAYTVQDESFALACLGDCAVDPLIDLLNNEDDWLVINAAFALGEIGTHAARGIPKLSGLLRSSDPHVVKAILEAIACIGSNTAAALLEISRLLYCSSEELGLTDAPEHFGTDSIHYNAVYALLLSDLDIEDIEDLLIYLLKASTTSGRVAALALEILVRKGSTRGRRQAIEYLQAHRWDDSGWPPEIREKTT